MTRREVIEKYKRRWFCLRNGHDWAIQINAMVGGPNHCRRCGKVVEW